MRHAPPSTLSGGTRKVSTQPLSCTKLGARLCTGQRSHYGGSPHKRAFRNGASERQLSAHCSALAAGPPVHIVAPIKAAARLQARRTAQPGAKACRGVARVVGRADSACTRRVGGWDAERGIPDLAGNGRQRRRLALRHINGLVAPLACTAALIAARTSARRAASGQQV